MRIGLNLARSLLTVIGKDEFDEQRPISGIMLTKSDDVLCGVNQNDSLLYRELKLLTLGN